MDVWLDKSKICIFITLSWSLERCVFLETWDGVYTLGMVVREFLYSHYE